MSKAARRYGGIKIKKPRQKCRGEIEIRLPSGVDFAGFFSAFVFMLYEALNEPYAVVIFCIPLGVFFAGSSVDALCCTVVESDNEKFHVAFFKGL
jgi:hypothetical protein